MSEPLTPEELETYRRMTFEPYDVSRLFATIDSLTAERRDDHAECWDTIDRLSQELKAAREERDIIDAQFLEAIGMPNEKFRRMEHAEIEAEKLRAALKDLQAGTPTSSTGLHALAAAALTETEETGDE